MCYSQKNLEDLRKLVQKNMSFPVDFMEELSSSLTKNLIKKINKPTVLSAERAYDVYHARRGVEREVTRAQPWNRVLYDILLENIEKSKTTHVAITAVRYINDAALFLFFSNDGNLLGLLLSRPADDVFALKT